jgi:hypothetical protein
MARDMGLPSAYLSTGMVDLIFGAVRIGRLQRLYLILAFGVSKCTSRSLLPVLRRPYLARRGYQRRGAILSSVKDGFPLRLWNVAAMLESHH